MLKHADFGSAVQAKVSAQEDTGEGCLTRSNNRFSKVEFPKFEGKDVEAVHLEGRALQWHQSYIKISGISLSEMAWNNYVRSISARFASTLIEDVMGDLKALTQTGNFDLLEDYCDKFDLLLNKVNICQEYAISLFLEGLKPGIGTHVRMFRPKTLKDAYSLSRLQNHANTIGSNNSAKLPLLPTPLKALPAASTNFNRTTTGRRLSSKEFDEKRRKGECFWCNDKFTPGHNCKNKRLFLFEVVEGEEEIVGAIGTKQLQILIDSGSIHNFLNDKLADKLKCATQTVKNMLVTIVDGNHLPCMKLCKDFQWLMQGNGFKADMLVIPLSTYDIVLGIQWLQTLNDINWNFKQLTMKFKVGGKSLVIKGTNVNNITMCSMEKFNNMVQNSKQITHGQLFSLQLMEGEVFQHQPTIEGSQIPPPLQTLLDEYQEIFELPKGLPPSRDCDHKIQLKDKSIQLNLKPYRYPAAQKNIIEQMTQELLDSGVIRNCTSSFAASVVLVRKKDVFFDDILVYSRNMQQHVQDLAEVLSLMKIHSLKAKRPKCTFGGSQVEYLGHIISAMGVATDPKKIQAIMEWPVPTTVKQLRGFLGLAGSPLVLALSDFSKEFVIETDASAKVGYDYEIYYKRGSENSVAAALSRVQGLALCTMSVSSLQPMLWQRIQHGWQTDPNLKELLKCSIGKVVLKMCIGTLKNVLFVNEANMRRAISGLLQPLPLPQSIFSDISMYFISGHPFTATQLAQVFLDNIFKFHGCPTNIVSDRDPLFLSHFWREFTRLRGINLAFSSAYHLQSDGQTEVLNRCLESYLRSMSMDTSLQWVKWLPLARWWHNTTFHSAIKMYPYEALFGIKPPIHIPYISGDTQVAAVEELHRDREAMIYATEI
ncbi:hypothetical protein E3N88_15442 [Mikania micrantha]|uniref:Integrase catalytic domain-containing protein n=1 Tax=Mikania micrantha TaxID=192012 RepID=A0A5N6NW12_9ASTR|nr:hypothetical protein E3N88_15442 [Mikania micrantha]